MKKTLLLTIFFNLIFNLTFAQVKPDEIKRTDRNGNPKMIEFQQTQIASDTNSVKTFLKTQYQVNEDVDFRALKDYTITYKGLHGQKYQQYYKGIPVEFGIINTVSRNNNLHVVNGDYFDIKELNTTLQLSEAQALEAAKAHIGAESYMWEDEANNEFLRQEQNDPNASFFPKGELVIIEKDMFGEKPIPVLVYRFDIYASKPMSRNYVYIDAKDGEVVFVNSMLHHVDGTADTRYSGNRTIQTEFDGVNYRLRDYSRGNGIETYDMNDGISFALATDFLDSDNNWSAGEYGNGNPLQDDAALDAHWGAAMTYDYFATQHGRNSYDNNGAVIRNYVHYNNSWDNASWDGQRVWYGDGNAGNDPWTSLDIVAHEIAHGICQAMVPPFGLIYQGESGAINEGLSDIWGAMVEFSADPTKQTYIIGEDFTLGDLGIRSMEDPHAFNHPNTYQDITYWYDPNCPDPANEDNCGVHINSGVLNHWFYLLAEGDGGTVTGIGKTDAAAIVYAAESLYFTPTTNFIDARYLTLQAAADLYGDGSTEYTNVYNAWHTVGIGDVFTPTTDPWTLLGQDIDGEAADDWFGESVSLNSDGTIVAIGASGNDGNGNWSGHVRIYQWDGISWSKLGQDIDGEAVDDRSGESVNLNDDGTIVAIGARFNDDNGFYSGHVRIYQWDGMNWNQLGQDIVGEAAEDYSGSSVSLSNDGSIVAIGAPANDGNAYNSGHVRVYQFDGIGWNQLGQDIDGEASIDLFGRSVSLSANGSIVAIGAELNNGNGNNSGHVQIYQWDGMSWNQLGQDIDGEAAEDQSGWAVSLSANGNIVAIGALFNDGNGGSSGHVRVFQFDGATWSQIGQDIDGEAGGDNSGRSISLSSDGSIVAIGADQNDGNGNNSGHVRIYQWNGANWNQLGGQDIDGEADDDRSGYSVSLSSDGNIVAIGAFFNDGNGNNSGHVRIYEYNAAYTTIPDPNFEQALINQGIDSEATLDGQVLTSDISGITNLLIPSLGINDLTGIEDFVALEVLTCSDNNLSGLYLGHNVNLTALHCDTNQINNLDLRGNVNLTVLTCSANELIGLELSNNVNLVTLFCHDNNLLNTLDLTGLASLENVVLTANPNLGCIQVDNAADANAEIGIYDGWDIDNMVSTYSEDCNDFHFTYIPDSNFEAALAGQGYDNMLGDNQVPTARISGITELDVSLYEISDLTGIEDFAALEILNCNVNNLTTLNLSENTNLVELRCIGNGLTSLNVSGLTNLTQLYCGENQLTDLDVSTNTNLSTLWCNYNDLTFVDLSSNNNLTNLNISNNRELTFLDCSNNNITTLNIANSNNIQELRCEGNQLTSLNVIDLGSLQTLYCDNNDLTTLNVSENSDLQLLHCYNNQLTGSLNLSELHQLQYFSSTGNPDLECIQVEDPEVVDAQEDWYVNWLKDPATIYSEDCGAMARSATAASDIKSPDSIDVKGEETDMEGQFIIYPNPAKDQFSIALPPGQKLLNVIIYNIQGEQVASSKTTTVSVAHLPKSVYFMEIQTLDNKKVVKKVLISRD